MFTKPLSRLACLSATILLVATANVAIAQLGVPWWSIDGGGATFCTAGGFELGGTLAQPDAAQSLSGGGFQLVGGFWAIGWAVGGCTCPGDLDADCDVDLSDLTLNLSTFGCCNGHQCYNAAYDINGDGCIDLSDLTIVLSSFGVTCN